KSLLGPPELHPKLQQADVEGQTSLKVGTVQLRHKFRGCHGQPSYPSASRFAESKRIQLPSSNVRAVANWPEIFAVRLRVVGVAVHGRGAIEALRSEHKPDGVNGLTTDVVQTVRGGGVQ